MKHSQASALLLLLLSSALCVELIQVHVLTRHGDRSPAYPMPSARFPYEWQCPGNIYSVIQTDASVSQPIYFKKAYKAGSGQFPGTCGVGQLTEIGIRQHVQLGTLLRERYVYGVNATNILLDKTLNEQEVVVESTDIDRTFQSAQSLISGLYPSVTNGLTSVTVTTTDMERSDLYPNYATCARLKNVLQEIQQFKEWKEYHEGLAEFQKHVSALLNVTAPLPWVQLYDAFWCRRSHNVPVPHGFTDEMVDRFISIAEWEWSFYMHAGNLTREYVGLGMGPLLRRIKSRMEARMKNEITMKFALYSGHDTTIGPLLGFFNHYDGKWPAYASNLILELYRLSAEKDMKDTSNYAIRVLYNSKPLKIAGCEGEICTFPTFTAILEKSIPHDLEKACEVKS